MLRKMFVVVAVVLSGAMSVHSRPQQPGEHGGVATITGCITVGENSDTYKLTSANDRKVLTVTSSNDPKVDLKSKVGHMVQVTGKWNKSEGAKTLKAEQVVNLSDNCSDIKEGGKESPK